MRVALACVCGSDLVLPRRRAVPAGTDRHEFIGIVEETGGDVRNLKPGDTVAVIGDGEGASDDPLTTNDRDSGEGQQRYGGVHGAPLRRAAIDGYTRRGNAEPGSRCESDTVLATVTRELNPNDATGPTGLGRRLRALDLGVRRPSASVV